MGVVGTQIQEQEAPYSSIPSQLACGPRTQELIAQGVLEEFPVQIVELLLEVPAYGLTFLEDFLAIAQVEPETDEKPSRFAFCCVQNVRELAQTMGWGYDTVHKYVMLFCALGLLQKYRYRHKVILQFPLRGYIFPDSLEELDKLIGKSRSRVQSLAARVKARCLELQMVNQAPICPQNTEPYPAVSRIQNSDTITNSATSQTDANTNKYIADEDKTKTYTEDLADLQNNQNKNSEEATLIREMHEYTAECSKEQRQAIAIQRSDLFAALVTQFLLNDKCCYEKYAPQLSAGEILHISIIKNKKAGEISAQDEIITTCDIYPQYFEPGFPVNRYAWEYLGYNPKFESSMYENNRQDYHLDFFEISSHYTPIQSQSYVQSVPTPQETSPATSVQESEPSDIPIQKAEVASATALPVPENEHVLYEEVFLPAGMPKLRQRWLAEGRIVERLDANGKLKTYKICKEQTQCDKAQALALHQTYSQADEQTTPTLRNTRRKRPIYTQDSLREDGNGQMPQIMPQSPIEITKQEIQTEQAVAAKLCSQQAILTPTAKHISTTTQTILDQKKTKHLEQIPLDKSKSASKQKKSSLSHKLLEAPKPTFPLPAIQAIEQISSTETEDIMMVKDTMSEHLIPLECWDKEVIAEYERMYKQLPGNKLDFSYEDIKHFQTVYKDFPSAETFLEVDAFRDWYGADFDEDFLLACNTLNVITFIKYIINNKNNIQKRNTFITFLVTIFDKNSNQKEKSASYYYQLFKNDYHPDVISCAFLSTLLAMYSKGRETIEKPGAIFIKNCQILQKKVSEEGHIPYNDLKAARKFGNFTFTDLAVALHDNLVLDGATERLSVHLAVTFATNSCYRAQNRLQDPCPSYQDTPRQRKKNISNTIYGQVELQTSERRVS